MYTRGKIGSGSTGRAALADLRTLFARGVKICVPIAETRRTEFDFAATKEALRFLSNEVGAENLCAIESANEYNKPSSRPADWVRRLREFQKWLHENVRAERAFANVPVVAPSMWGRLTNDYRALGSLEPYVDRGCIHYYTGGRRPTQTGLPNARGEGGGLSTQTLAKALADAKTLAPSKRLWMTEFGYPVAGPGSIGRSPVSEEVAAKYLIRGLFDAFGAGVEKLFIYTLIDDVHRSPPRYHGMIDGRMRPRRSYHALRNLMALFADGRMTSPSRPLDYTYSGGGNLKRHLFQKTDGTFLLCMYQDVDSYDRLTVRDIAVPPVNVRLSFNKPQSGIELFTPTLGAAAVQRLGRSTSVNVPVGDHVSVVRITP